TIGGKPIPAGVDPVPEPEIAQEQLDLTDAFVRFLAPPTPLKLGQEGRRGRELFSQIGCAACHVPTLRTGDSPVPALRNKEFPAYTDLLLHDMGSDLADICLGLATPSEFRTEPLLDLRDAKAFLHDGRHTTLGQAIEAHGGAASSVDPGQVVASLGPNGAGKSTTMRMITQCYEPDSGEIRLDSVPLADAAREAKRRIGYLPENNPQYDDMLVVDYLAFIADL